MQKTLVSLQVNPQRSMGINLEWPLRSPWGKEQMIKKNLLSMFVYKKKVSQQSFPKQTNIMSKAFLQLIVKCQTNQVKASQRFPFTGKNYLVNVFGKISLYRFLYELFCENSQRSKTRQMNFFSEPRCEEQTSRKKTNRMFSVYLRKRSVSIHVTGVCELTIWRFQQSLNKRSRFGGGFTIRIERMWLASMWNWQGQGV